MSLRERVAYALRKVTALLMQIVGCVLAIIVTVLLLILATSVCLGLPVSAFFENIPFLWKIYTYIGEIFKDYVQ